MENVHSDLPQQPFGGRTRRRRTDVPSLCEDDAQEEDKEQNSGSNPTIRSVGSRGIEVGLVLL